MKSILIGIIALLVLELCTLQSAAAAEGVYVVKPVAKMKVKQLPPGPLYWQEKLVLCPRNCRN